MHMAMYMCTYPSGCSCCGFLLHGMVFCQFVWLCFFKQGLSSLEALRFFTLNGLAWAGLWTVTPPKTSKLWKRLQCGLLLDRWQSNACFFAYAVFIKFRTKFSMQVVLARRIFPANLMVSLKLVEEQEPKPPTPKSFRVPLKEPPTTLNPNVVDTFLGIPPNSSRYL